jgi:Family of unknown function (DUF6193)
MTENLYPEISKVGSLTKALNNEFEKIRCSLTCTIYDDLHKLPFAYARVEKDNRYSQVYLAAKQKLFLSDFWRDGVCLAHGNTESINELAKVLDYWLSSDNDTKSLRNKFQFVTANEKAVAFDEKREVEYTWNLILNDNSRADIRNFVELAINDTVLSKLFPFASLTRLCFSRCTGYPYTHDTPIVIPISADIYEVRLSNNDVVGRGTAQKALAMVKSNLPLDIKPAISGTANDLENFT